MFLCQRYLANRFQWPQASVLLQQKGFYLWLPKKNNYVLPGSRTRPRDGVWFVKISASAHKHFYSGWNPLEKFTPARCGPGAFRTGHSPEQVAVKSLANSPWTKEPLSGRPRYDATKLKGRSGLFSYSFREVFFLLKFSRETKHIHGATMVLYSKERSQKHYKNKPKSADT